MRIARQYRRDRGIDGNGERVDALIGETSHGVMTLFAPATFALAVGTGMTCVVPSTWRKPWY